MNRRTAGLPLYPLLAPMRWLKVAAAYADQEVARLCSNRWRNGVLVPVAMSARVRRHHER